jgi:hypothetical protein
MLFAFKVASLFSNVIRLRWVMKLLELVASVLDCLPLLRDGVEPKEIVEALRRVKRSFYDKLMSRMSEAELVTAVEAVYTVIKILRKAF